MPRARIYQSDAERQAAYRRRLAQRQAALDGDNAVAALAELEQALAATRRRADHAEGKARQAGQDLATARHAQHADAERIAALEATVADLRHQLAARHATPTDPAGRPLNRAQRRRAQRQQPRPR